LLEIYVCEVINETTARNQAPYYYKGIISLVADWKIPSQKPGGNSISFPRVGRTPFGWKIASSA